jgi:hypothetical protein
MNDKEKDDSSEKFAKEAELMQRGQILLGVAAFRQQPKWGLSDLIKFLQEESGIRFTYFSRHTTQKTKAFGAKLGVEVDWNCCVSLKDEGVELDVEDLNAKLPHGIDSIRDHVKNIDDVPLRVSLFSDSTQTSIKEMVSLIYFFYNY